MGSRAPNFSPIYGDHKVNAERRSGWGSRNGTGVSGSLWKRAASSPDSKKTVAISAESEALLAAPNLIGGDSTQGYGIGGSPRLAARLMPPRHSKQNQAGWFSQPAPVLPDADVA